MTEILTPAAPADDPEDWWTRLYDSLHDDTGAHRPAARPMASAGDRLPPPGQVVDLDKPVDQAPADESDDPKARAPRRPLREYIADHDDPDRRWTRLVYSGTAAGAGWCLGFVGKVDHLLASCAADTGDPIAALILGAGVLAAALLLVDRRTRGWYAPLAWVCRIPLASAALALALFTPAITL